MLRIASAAVLSLSVLACLAAPVRADEIRTRAGKPITDVEVLDETYEKVTYKILGSQQEEPASNVIEVAYTRAPVGFAEAMKDFDAGQFAKAADDLKAYTSARETGPRQAALFGLGESRRQTGDLAGAQESFEKLLADFPKTRYYARTKVSMGLILMEQKQFSAAQKMFEDLSAEAKTLKLGDDVVSEANLRLAALLEMQGKLKEAQDRYERVAAAAPAESHGQLMAQVAALRIKGTLDPNKADSSASSLQSIFDGHDPSALKAGARADFELLAACSNALGEVRAAKGDYQKAMVDFLRVCYDPDMGAIAAERPRALFGAAAAIEKVKTDDWKARAESLRAELRQSYPNSPFAKKVGG